MFGLKLITEEEYASLTERARYSSYLEEQLVKSQAVVKELESHVENLKLDLKDMLNLVTEQEKETKVDVVKPVEEVKKRKTRRSVKKTKKEVKE